MKSDNPAMYGFYKQEMEIGRQVTQLSLTLTRTDDPNRRSELVAELREKFTEQFDVSQARQREQIKQFKDQVGRLERLLDAREKSRPQWVEKQIDLILHPPKPGVMIQGTITVTSGGTTSRPN